jgi:hypothetical protein
MRRTADGGHTRDATVSRAELTHLPPEYFGHGRRPRKFASAAWFVLGSLMFLMMFISVVLLRPAFAQVPLGWLVGGIAGALISLVLGIPAAKCLIHAKRLRAPSALEVLARDHRAPVVYFRPFTADTDASRTVGPTSWFTEEEELAKMMNDIGPLVAIGAPAEAQPLLGAARMYVEDPKWHEAALDLARRARLVIMRIGSSPGFWWELEVVLKSIKPEQLVMLIPRNQALYEDFQRASRKLIPTVLPMLTGWDVKKWFRGNLKAVIFFDPTWVPSIVDVQTYRLPFLRRSPAMPLVPVLRMALRPVYENAGLPWTAPRVDRRMLVVLAAAAFFVISQVLLVSPDRLPWPSSSEAPFVAPSVVSDSPASRESTSLSQEGRRQSTIAEVESRMGDRLTAIPSVHRASEEMLNSPEFRALPREEKSARAREFGREHARAGFRRLDDAALLAKLELDRKILASAEPGACAAFCRGKISTEQLHAMLGKIEVPDIERWYDLIVQAVRADVEGVPLRSADPGRINQSLASILNALPEKDSRKFRRIMAGYDRASDEEVCWSERTLRDGIASLNERDRVLWALRIAE